MQPLELRHLTRRFGFETPWIKTEEFASKSAAETLKMLLQAESSYKPLRFFSADRPKDRNQLKGKSKEEKKKLKTDSGLKILSLRKAWLQEMINAPVGIREKMALIWHSNLACRSPHYFATEDYLDILRRNALGNYKTMVTEMAHAMCMLEFLSNQLNRKGNPNENFGRELLELFTLGRGHYTEQDIKEASRAFTGWGFDPASAQFEFKAEWHDEGSKTFLGKTGNWNGNDIIDIIFANEQTSVYITRKVYRWIIQEQPVEAEVSQAAKAFFNSGYDIQTLLLALVKLPSFTSSRGTQIKNPTELLVGTSRILGLSFANDRGVQKIMQVLGMPLFFPPNVSGWTIGRSWIDNSRLLVRLNLPQLLLTNGTPTVTGPDDLQDLMIYNQTSGTKEDGWGAKIDTKCLDQMPKSDNPQPLIDLFLAEPAVPEAWKSLLDTPVSPKMSSYSQHVRWTSRILATPEFQVQ